jgi:uncharacterized membrane protein YidH (DUF202 family)
MGAVTALKDGLEYTATAFACGVFLHGFFDDRIKVNVKRLSVIFGTVVVLSFLDLLLQKQFGWNLILLPAFFLCTAIVLQWDIKADFTGFIKRLIFIISTDIAISVYSLELVMLGASLAGISDAAAQAGMRETGESLGFYLAYVGLVVLIGAVLYYLTVRRGAAMRFRSSDIILTIAMGTIILLSLGLYMYIENNEMVKLYRIGLEAMLLLLLLVMPMMIYKNRQSAYFIEMSAHNESYLEAELTASRQYRESQEETRAFRHDMRNNLTLLAGLMQEKKYEEAEQYIRDLNGELAALSPTIITGDDMLDSLLSSKLGELERQGITLTINGVIDGGLSWKPIDICAVFANALDNAMRACQAMPEDAEKYIRISFRKTELQRVISIVNSSAKPVDCAKLLSGEGRYTTKSDKSRHGYGLYNIRRTVEKYGGMLKVSSEDKEFRLTIVLT